MAISREEYLNAALKSNESFQKIVDHVEIIKSMPRDAFGEAAKANPDLVLDLIDLLVDHIRLERNAHQQLLEEHFSMIDRIAP